MSASTPRDGNRFIASLGERRGALIALSVIIAAFLLFAVAWSLFPHTAFIRVKGDGAYYETLAKQLLTRGVYGYQSTRPNAWRTPGFPLFLAAVYRVTGYSNRPGGPYVLLYFIQILFGAGSIALTYLVGSELLGRRPGLLAALLVAIYPPTQQSAIQVLTEPLTLVLFLAYVYVQLLAVRRDRTWLWFAAGVTFASAVMVRPGLALVGLVPLLYVAATRRDWRRLGVQAAVLLAGFALVVAPWFVRNVITLHRPIILAEQTGDPVLAGADPYYYDISPKYEFAGPSYFAYTKLESSGAPHPSKMDFALQVIGNRLRMHPSQTIEWFTLGKLRSMFVRLFASGGGQTLESITWVVHLAIVVIGFLGMVLSIKDRRFRMLTFMIIVGVVSLLPYVPEPRYVYAFIPLLAVLAAGTMQRAWDASPGLPDEA